MGAGQFIRPVINDHKDKYHRETGLLIPLLRKKIMVSTFSSGDWEKTSTGGTIADDIVNCKYGTKSIKMTNTDDNPVSIDKSISISTLRNKIFVVNIYVDDISKLWYVSTLFSVGDSYFSKYLGQKQDTLYANSGWYTIAQKTSRFAFSGGATDLKDIHKIRFKVYPKTGQIVNVTVDSMYIIDDIQDKGKVVITFDDGSNTVYSIAKPKMDGYGFPGVCYVITSIVGTGDAMTVSQLTNLYDNGWDICSHSKTHQNLTTLTAPDLLTELRDSYTWLIDNGFTRSARHFAYPGGNYNDAVIAQVKKIYQTARTTEKGFETAPLVNRHALKQYCINNMTTLATVQEYIDQCAAKKDTIILTFHKLVETPSSAIEWAISDFNNLIDYISSKNVDVVTLTELIACEPGLLDHRVQANW